MHAAAPSQTAYRVALRRAAHQVFDRPLVFPDPLAVRILGLDAGSPGLRAPERASSRSLRAFLVARSAFAEEVLRDAVSCGVSQYLLLGAGLDTFAYRNPDTRRLHVFEVDHPATQAWKMQLIERASLMPPAAVTHVPVDFECDSLPDRLLWHGFDPEARTQVSWLGVVPYLTEAAFIQTLHWLATLPPGSGVVLDYALPRELLSSEEQRERDSLAARVAAAGEPFRTFCTPEQMEIRLREHGFRITLDLDPPRINRRYFSERSDGLAVLGTGAHLLSAIRVAGRRTAL